MKRIAAAKTKNFDVMLLEQACAAMSPDAITPLIRMAKEMGAKGTVRQLKAIQQRISSQSSKESNRGLPDDYKPLGGWSIKN